jgi:hypothetical protein
VLEAAAGDGAAAGAPPVAAAVDLAEMPDEADVPPLVAAVVVAADVVDVDVAVEEGVAAAIGGSPTAPDDPLVSAAPATPEAVAAVWAAPGPASATSSGRTIRTIRNSWAMAASDPNLTPFMRRIPHRSSLARLSRMLSAPHRHSLESGNPAPKCSVACPVQAGQALHRSLAGARSAALEAAGALRLHHRECVEIPAAHAYRAFISARSPATLQSWITSSNNHSRARSRAGSLQIRRTA